MKRSVQVAIVFVVLAGWWFAPSTHSLLNVAAACSPGPPSVSGISPAVGPPGGGTAVTITGCGFTGATAVDFGSASATFTVDSDTQVTASSPHQAPGVLDVTVVTPLGTSATSASDQFNVTDACQSVSLAPDQASPQQSGAIVTFTAIATNCSNPEYLFYLEMPIPGGSWYPMRGYGGPSWAWDTHGYAPGDYHVDVWVRQAGSGVYLQAIKLIGYSLNPGGAPCTNATVTPDKASWQGVGTIITFTATSTGCTDPEYLFFVRHRGVWTPMQGYGGPTFVWNTAGLEGVECINAPNCAGDGGYSISLWVRQRGSGVGYQSFQVIDYLLVRAAACPSAATSADKASPEQVGTIIRFTGSTDPAYCQQAQYQWFVQAPGSGWMLAQPYSLSPTFVWNTASLALGVYNISMWLRENGSAASYEAFKVISYTLTVPSTCAAAGITLDKPSPQTTSTIVTLTAGSTGCSQPQYLFYVQAPGAGWIPAFGWDGPAFVWNTTGLGPGTYHIDVWARQNGSAAPYETFTLIGYTLIAQLPACAGATITPDKASPQPRGTVVTFIANSTVCSDPEYLFYVQPPSGGWYVAQGYGGFGSNAFGWGTASLAPGDYHVDVWAREVGSSAPYESFQNISYTVI